jgi:hypothetical protein
MSYPQYMTIEQFERNVYHTFIHFVTRKEVLTHEQAHEEVRFLKDCGLDLTSKMSCQERMNRYLTKQRIGATFQIDRKTRKHVMMSLENAINHAAFADELKGHKLGVTKS